MYTFKKLVCPSNPDTCAYHAFYLVMICDNDTQYTQLKAHQYVRFISYYDIN